MSVMILDLNSNNDTIHAILAYVPLSNFVKKLELTLGRECADSDCAILWKFCLQNGNSYYGNVAL